MVVGCLEKINSAYPNTLVTFRGGRSFRTPALFSKLDLLNI